MRNNPPKNSKPLVKIANIQLCFCSTSKSKDKKERTSLIDFKNQIIKEGVRQVQQKNQRKNVIMRNSFIPRRNIRSQVQFQKSNKESVQRPLRPASMAHSMFPVRKPILVKGTRNYIPIFKEKIFSFVSRQDHDQSNLRFSNTTDKLRGSSDKLRATTASCLTLPKKQIEPPGEQIYTVSAKAARKYRKKTHDDRWEEIERLFF